MSFLDGYGTPDQVVGRIAELGHKAVAVTDHGNVFAHVPLQRAAKKAGITPIFGCEFYVCDDMNAREKGAASIGADSLPHVTILARTQEGYRNLIRLHNKAWREGFYYKARVDWEEIFRHQEGLVVMSGCVGGYPSRLALDKGPEAAWEFVSWVASNIEHYFVELIPQPGLDISHRTVPALVNIAKDLKLPTVLTADAHFPRPEDHQAQDLMLSVGLGRRVDDPSRKIRLPAYQYYCTEEELLQRARQVAPEIGADVWAESLRNADRIASAAGGVEIPRAERVSFAGLKPNETAFDRLWAEVVKGATARGVLHLSEYAARATREFEVLQSKGFADYILVVADVVQWAKSRGGLVILRGSAGGCLLLWLLGASCTDPIRHRMSFERFYDSTRPDPPDVDIDFEQAMRDEAIEYVYSQYGAERCSRIAALSQLKAKAALQDAAKGLGVPRPDFEALSKALDTADEDVDRQLSTVTDVKALEVLQRHPNLRIFERLIGQYRQSSTHACGVLVSSIPLEDCLGVVMDREKKPVACVDKKGCEYIGALKMDFLAVRSLDVIALAAKKAGLTAADLYAMAEEAMDDEATLQMGANGMLAGVFQLSGAAAARVSGQIGLTSFEDVYAAGALCRPGPADWVDTYRGNKADPKQFRAYLQGMHPTAAKIVEPTYGILLYQEQVMALANELAGLDWPLVHRLRKEVAAKKGLDPQTGDAWRAEWSERFVGGCVSRGVDRREAEFWWESVQTHGGYSFNLSHCVSYGVEGYWMLWLKAHYPAQYYEAYLQIEDRPDKIKPLIAEFRQMGGVVRLLDPEHSQETFTAPEPWVLVGGYQNIKGLGPAAAAKMVAAGPFDSWAEMLMAMPPGVAGKLEDAMTPSGGWDAAKTVYLAPWMPVVETLDSDAEAKARWGLQGTADLPLGTMLEGDAVLCGYVTWEKKEGDRLMFQVEDEDGVALVRVAYRRVAELGEKVRQVKLGDYAAFSGWWAGEALFIKDAIVLRAAELPRSMTRSKGPEPPPLPPLPDWNGVEWIRPETVSQETV